MLLNDVNEFNWTADNFGATYSEAGFGTGMTTGAANTKGTAVTLLSGATVTEDVYGIALNFFGGATSAAVRQFLADLLIDEAGGTSWSAKIANLIVDAPSLLFMGYSYYFPLYIKAGTSIGMQAQCQAATIALRCAVKVFGKPSHPHLLRVGTRVETLGADTATSAGVVVTPGTNALGAYTASLGTLANDNWWWQMGYAINDSTITSAVYHLDVKAGNGTNDKLCIEGILTSGSAVEQMAKTAFGYGLPIRRVAAGSNVYVRAAAMAGAPDSNVSVCAYALG